MDARALALSVLTRWEQSRQPLDDLLDRALSGPASADTRLATELVYGIMRRLGTLDWRLGQLLRDPLAKLPMPIRWVLRIGAYQLLYLDRIPASAAVNEAVKQAKRVGHAGTAKLTNGVLRNLLRRLPELPWPDDPVARLAATWSLPDWLAGRWIDRYGFDEATALAQAMADPAPTYVRVNTRRTDRETLLAAFHAAGITAEPAVLPDSLRVSAATAPPQWPGYAEGWWYIQDLGSMAVALAVAPLPGETVVDLCAAPGGKTTHLAALMADQGRVEAWELSARRAERLAKNVARLGLGSVAIHQGDAAVVTPDVAADRVLVDAPCSGLGVIRRKPDIRWRVTPQSLAELQPTQDQLLQAAAQWVRPGGVLVYSTCSTEPDENGRRIDAFLAARPDFTPEALPPVFPSEWLADQPLGQLSLLPHRHGTDGFFIARLRRQV